MDRCEGCGFDYDAVPPPSVAEAVRALPPRYAGALRQAEADGLARTRPEPGTWSALEYTCHLRDVFRFQHERLLEALRQVRPTFASMRRDERAIEERYNEQPVGTVLRDLAAGTERFAAALEQLEDRQWDRTGVYPWPAATERSMAWLARHTLHEGVHHLQDVVGGLERLRQD